MRFGFKTLAVGLGLAASLAAAAPTQAAWIYANGGAYFKASGPAQYWHYDYGEGYCGKYGKWCSPGYSQWTYTSNAMYGCTNTGTWTIAPAQQYLSRIYAFVPRRNATANPAFYEISYANVSSREVPVYQVNYYDQWVQLGEPLYKIGGVWACDNRQGFGSLAKVAFDEIKIEN